MSEKEKKLLEEGWEKRMIACEPKLTEVAELYREIGFDVIIIPLSELMDESCSDDECMRCYELDKDRYSVIYTRSKD